MALPAFDPTSRPVADPTGRSVPDATPVVVGVGQHCPKAPEFARGGPIDLAAAAARQALADSGRPEALAAALDAVVFCKLFADTGLVPSPQGKSSKLSGRLTEVFVRRAGRWWHPGWHLDLASTP